MRISRIALLLLAIFFVENVNAFEKRAIVPTGTVAKPSETIEGSGDPKTQKEQGPDQETTVQGSGYPSDDEDDAVQGSGNVVEGSGAPAWHPVPALTTTTTTTPAPVDTDHVVGEEHTLQVPATDPVRTEVFEIPRTTEVPVFFGGGEEIVPPRREETTPATTTTASTTTKTTRRPGIPAAVPPREEEAATPFHHMLKPGVFAAIVGGCIVGLLATVFIIVFIVYRMRKKDEGSYALDEPKARPYAGYAYTKASTKEFYA